MGQHGGKSGKLCIGPETNLRGLSALSSSLRFLAIVVIWLRLYRQHSISAVAVYYALTKLTSFGCLLVKCCLTLDSESISSMHYTQSTSASANTPANEVHLWTLVLLDQEARGLSFWLNQSTEVFFTFKPLSLWKYSATGLLSGLYRILRTP